MRRRQPELEDVDCDDGRQRCVYCARKMLRRRDHMTPEQISLTATKDHKRPKALGGTNDKENYLICCARCNGMKGNIPYEVFKVFADMVLLPYPDLPLPVLRNSLTAYIMHLLERAVSQNRKAMRDACTISLLSLAEEIKSFEKGNRHAR